MSQRPASELRGSRYELRTHDDSAITEHHALELVTEGRWGFLHSQESGSAVDGPGIRVVFWTTGCEFRCLYCHNPDTWKLKHGRLVCADDILTELKKYRDYLRMAGGGVTISGGEPLVQDRFVMNILRGARELGIHTALDTNGFLGSKLTDEDLSYIDLVLLDIKSWDPETHKRLTSNPVTPVLNFATRIAALDKPMWIRFVLVPGLTDAHHNIEGVADFAASLGTVQRMEVLPFHQLGKFKWQQLGMRYELAEARAPSTEELTAARELFRARGLNCPG